MRVWPPGSLTPFLEDFNTSLLSPAQHIYTLFVAVSLFSLRDLHQASTRLSFIPSGTTRSAWLLFFVEYLRLSLVLCLLHFYRSATYQEFTRRSEISIVLPSASYCQGSPSSTSDTPFSVSRFVVSSTFSVALPQLPIFPP